MRWFLSRLDLLRIAQLVRIRREGFVGLISLLVLPVARLRCRVLGVHRWRRVARCAGVASLMVAKELRWVVVAGGSARVVHVRLLLLVPGGLHLTCIGLVVVNDHLKHLELVLLQRPHVLHLLLVDSLGLGHVLVTASGLILYRASLLLYQDAAVAGLPWRLGLHMQRLVHLRVVAALVLV